MLWYWKATIILSSYRKQIKILKITRNKNLNFYLLDVLRSRKNQKLNCAKYRNSFRSGLKHYIPYFDLRVSCLLSCRLIPMKPLSTLNKDESQVLELKHLPCTINILPWMLAICHKSWTGIFDHPCESIPVVRDHENWNEWISSAHTIARGYAAGGSLVYKYISLNLYTTCKIVHAQLFISSLLRVASSHSYQKDDE